MSGFTVRKDDFMAKDNLGLMDFCTAALAAETGYVYGTFGQLCTVALLDQKARQYPASDLAGGAMRTVGNKWVGRRVTDCIGLIKYYLMSTKYGDNPAYLAQYDTLNADGLFSAAKESGPIGTLPEIPGLLLHLPGHVGVYIGGGYAIEAAGTSQGVIKTKVVGRGWDHWYKCIWLDYVQPDAVSDTTGTFTVQAGKTYQFKITSPVEPTLSCGSSCFKLTQTSHSGTAYYFKFKATGKAGEGAGFYLNGAEKPVAVANIR
jgi:hypothetical protein